MKKLNIKVGISDFAEIRDSGCYYIDKSGLISDLLQNNTAKSNIDLHDQEDLEKH